MTLTMAAAPNVKKAATRPPLLGTVAMPMDTSGALLSFKQWMTQQPDGMTPAAAEPLYSAYLMRTMPRKQLATKATRKSVPTTGGKKPQYSTDGSLESPNHIPTVQPCNTVTLSKNVSATLPSPALAAAMLSQSDLSKAAMACRCLLATILYFNIFSSPPFFI